MLTLVIASLAAATTDAAAVIETSACTIRNMPTPAFWSKRDTYPVPLYKPWMQYQVTNGRGTFAGMAYDDESGNPQMRVIRYSRGVVTVLDDFHYTSSWQPVDWSIRVVGIDPWGNVTVTVQVPTTAQEDAKTVVYRYSASGQRTQLQDSPLWKSFEAVGVASSGTVFGTARYGAQYAGTERLVMWTGPGHGTVTVLTGAGYRAGAVDSGGDVYYSQANYASAFVRKPSGQVNQLIGMGGTTAANFKGASSTAGFGLSYTDNQGFGTRWDGANAQAGERVDGHKVSYFVWISAVGASGDVVGDFPGNVWPDRGTRVLVRNTGKAYRMPEQFHTRNDEAEPRPAINAWGQVVYTGADGLAHVLSCPS